MLKAHSLLYSVYVCLIVAILCGALLYFASLYNQLNLFYNTNEQLYIQNQSAVNYALGSNLKEESVFNTDTSNVKSEIKSKPYGLLNVLLVSSYIKSDTITSSHFAGCYPKEKTCLHLSSISKPIAYSGFVKLIGDKQLPSTTLNQFYANNTENQLSMTGVIRLSESYLPVINQKYKTMSLTLPTKLRSFNSVERKVDSVYYNSFQNETIEIQLDSPILENIRVKGNFIIYAPDSIQVHHTAILEDVILKAPKITFKEDFQGAIQAFSSGKIHLEKRVNLQYPSVLCIYNTSENESKILISDECKIMGAVVQFGNQINTIDQNTIILHKNTLLIGDVYCYGKLMMEGKIYGSVYTNRLFHKTENSYYENCVMNCEIDVTKKPSYFISIPIFEEQNMNYGIYKKVL